MHHCSSPPGTPTVTHNHPLSTGLWLSGTRTATLRVIVLHFLFGKLFAAVTAILLLVVGGRTCVVTSRRCHSVWAEFSVAGLSGDDHWRCLFLDEMLLLALIMSGKCGNSLRGQQMHARNNDCDVELFPWRVTCLHCVVLYCDVDSSSRVTGASWIIAYRQLRCLLT